MGVSYQGSSLTTGNALTAAGMLLVLSCRLRTVDSDDDAEVEPGGNEISLWWVGSAATFD